MLLDYNRRMAYMCPYCGHLTERDISLFDIPPGGAEFLCSEPACGAKVLTLAEKKDKYVSEIFCTACGAKHRFTFSKNSFWQKKLVFACPETLVDILFFGTDDEVEAELIKLENLYREAEEEICGTPEMQLYFDIIREVNRIAKESKVVCGKCGSQKASIELAEEGIRIVCRECGADKIIEVSDSAYMDLLYEGTIVLL